MKLFPLSKKGFILGVVIFLLVAGAAGTSLFFYSRNRELQKLVSDPQAISRQEMKLITGKLSSFLELPKDEEPMIATVLDKTKINDPFFKRAQNGDKLLIFTKSGRVLLYRPQTNKIIDFGVVNLSTPSAGQPGQPSAAIRVAVYNGTAQGNLTEKLANDLKTKVTNVELAVSRSSQKTDYEKTLVVDLTNGTKGDLAGQMAGLIKGAVSSLPEGEVKPATSSGQIDLLIILGNDYGK